MSLKPKDEEKEDISRFEMWEIFLNNDDFHDITLKGKDGVIVRANRYVLACRSLVFRKMLLGNFREANVTEVELGFDGCILQSLLQFIHTDTPDLLDIKKRQENDTDGPLFDVESLKYVLELSTAATYFNLPGLQRAVDRTLTYIWEECPRLSFVVLEACRQFGHAIDDDLQELATKRVRSIRRICTISELGSKTTGTDTDPTTCVLAEDVASLSPKTLEEIVKDPELEMTEYEIFCILFFWAYTSSSQAKESGERITIALELSQYVDLSRISPKKLALVVNPSGIVSDEQLSDAYKAQALLDASKSNIFGEPRQRWTTDLPVGTELPFQIKVEGAGSQEVNGIYKRDGFQLRLCKYKMDGVYLDEACSFYLRGWPCQLTCGARETNWEISICKENENSAGELRGKKFFYSNNAKKTYSMPHPPPTGWRKSLSGIVPAPVLKYHYRKEIFNQEDD